MPKIKEIKAREVLDSRGNPTVEAKVILEGGAAGKASVPSGASTGAHEAWELRDQDAGRYGGQGVLQAVKNIEKRIAPALAGQEAADLEAVDSAMIKLDGTKNKSRMGANAILAVSMAAARAAALERGQELFAFLAEALGFPKPDGKLPTPSFNIFNGGKHADTNLDFQEFMILPLSGKTRISTDKETDRHGSGKGELPFARMVRMGAEVFHELGRVLKAGGYDTDVGNEGGYAPDITSSIQAIEFIIAAVVNAGYKPGQDIGIGIDVGSSGLYSPETKAYIFKLDRAQYANTTLVGLYREWLRKYPIISIEDGLAEDDWAGWSEMNKELGSDMLIIGDDLFVTNSDRLRRGLKEKAANAILIKPNQVGTLSETAATIKLAKKHGLKTMASHRSGETEDPFIADLAVAAGCDYIKSGSLSRSERLAKYNRLMEIELLLAGKY